MIQTFQVRTSKQTELVDITRSVQEAVRKTDVEDGICIVFIPHTTAAVRSMRMRTRASFTTLLWS